MRGKLTQEELALARLVLGRRWYHKNSEITIREATSEFGRALVSCVEVYTEAWVLEESQECRLIVAYDGSIQYPKGQEAALIWQELRPKILAGAERMQKTKIQLAWWISQAVTAACVVALAYSYWFLDTRAITSSVLLVGSCWSAIQMVLWFDRRRAELVRRVLHAVLTSEVEVGGKTYTPAEMKAQH